MAAERSGSETIGQPDWFDLLHESVLVLDPRGTIVAFNQAAEKLYGHDRAHAIGTSADALLHTETIDPSGPPLTIGEEFNANVRRLRADGSELIIELRRAVRHTQSGEISSILETGRDLTESRRTQAALRQTEFRYRNLFHAMAASFWELDFSAVAGILARLRNEGVTDLRQFLSEHPAVVREMMRATRVLDINDQTLRLFGRGNRAELLVSAEPFWPEESNHVYAESVVAAVSGASHYVADARLRRIDGTTFDAVFTTCFAPDSVGRAKLLIGVLDISDRVRAFDELRRSEARYRRLFEAMAVSFWQVDTRALQLLFDDLRSQEVKDLQAHIDTHPDFLCAAIKAAVVTDVNERSLAMFGAKDRSELLGPLTRFWVSERSEALRDGLAAAYRGDTGYQAETRLRRVDGREIDVLHFIAPPTQSSGGDPIMLIGNIDLSDQVAARAAMRQLQNELAHAARISMLGELGSSIAHEVSQPLAAITTNGEAQLRWLSRPHPDIAEVREITQSMIDDARRAAGIIARVRAMSLRRSPIFDLLVLNDVVREAVHFLAHEFRSQNAAVDLQLSPGLPLIRVDRIQIQQVIVNLAINALQAMSTSMKGRRDLRIATSIDEPGYIRVDVEDTGPGIAPEVLPRLFESFFTTKPNGMGLGLPVCRSIAEAHGGRLSGTNRASGVGARFTLTLRSVDE